MKWTSHLAQKWTKIPGTQQEQSTIVCIALVLAGSLLVQCIQSQIKKLKIHIKKLSRHVNRIIAEKYR